MKRKNKKLLLKCCLSFFGIAFTISPINFLISKFETQNLSNNLKTANSERTLNDDVRLSFDNSNDNYESPNGIAKILSDNTIIFTSWFNKEIWRYDPKENNKILKTTFGNNINSLANLQLKYNSYNDTFLVYGKVNQDNFIFQLNASDGSEFIINNNVASSIWKTTSINGISNLVINENNGNVIVIPSYQNFSVPMSTSIAKFSSNTYSNVWYKFTSLQNNLTYNSENNIPVVFNVNDDIWGFTHFIKGTGSNLDKYMYLLFDYDLNFIVKSSEINIGSSSNQLHTDKIITTPLVFPFTNNSVKKYKIIDTSIAPIYTLDSINNDSIIDGTNEIRAFTFTPKNGQTNASISTDTSTSTDYISYQMKKDSKNNAFYISGFGKQSNNKIDYTKNKITGYKVDSSSGAITNIVNTLDETYTSQKAITNISIINDKNNKETKTALIKETKIYINTNSKISSSTQINTLNQSRYLIDISGSSPINFPTAISWNALIKDDYKNHINDQLKTKLPSDIDENSIKELVKFKSGTTYITNVTNSLKNLSLENDYELSGSKKILYNNSSGKLKAIVESNIKKWWYKDDDNSNYSSFKENTNIEIEGFYTLNGLSFKLVTSSEVDSTKWNKVQTTYIGKVLPSSISDQNIIDDFLHFGGNLKLTTSDISKINLDSSSTFNSQNTKAINVLYSDKNGTLEIKFDLTQKSSPSAGINNLIGSHTFDNFLKASSQEPITIDESKFSELKKKRLSNQFTVEDMLSIINASEIYDTNDVKKWKLTYDNEEGTNEFTNNLINGYANFTFKYLDANNLPSNINENNYTIVVSSKTTTKATNSNVYDGKGTQKILDYIWDDRVPNLISFDQNNANIITGSKSLNEIKNEINSIISQTVFINNRWFETDQLVATFNVEQSINKKAIFSLSFKDNKIISNINIIKNDGSIKKLVFDQNLRDELKKTKPNIFDLPTLTFNHSLLEFNWKYGLTSETNNMEISFNNLIEKVNEDRKANGLELFTYNSNILPSEFLKNFTNESFNKYFPLIDTNEKNTSTSDLWYYSLSKTEIIPNDENGTINVRYELVYPNLSTTTEIYKNPEVKITGLKSKSFTNTLAIMIISIVCFIFILFIIFIPIIIDVIRNKKINNNKIQNNKKILTDKYKKKVIKK